MDLPLPDVKVIKCKICNEDVRVNINYPIREVTCLRCWEASKNDKNL